MIGGLFVAGGAFLGTSIFELDLDLPAAAILLPIALAVGGTMVLSRSARVGWHVPAVPAAALATLLSVYGLIVAIGFPTLQNARPTARAGLVVRQRTTPDEPVGLYRLEQWRASLRYYSERPLTPLSSTDDVMAFTRLPNPVHVLMTRRDYRELRQQGIRLREVFFCRAVVGTVKGRAGLRRQKWDDLIVVTNAPPRRRGTALP